MNVQLTGTSRIVRLKSGDASGEILAQVYEGSTERGIDVQVMVAGVAAPFALAANEQDIFDAELSETVPPRYEVTVPARLQVGGLDPVRSLARKVLAVLNQQKKYFDTRERGELMKSKAMEGEMRRICEAFLSSPEAEVQTILFGVEDVDNRDMLPAERFR